MQNNSVVEPYAGELLKTVLSIETKKSLRDVVFEKTKKVKNMGQIFYHSFSKAVNRGSSKNKTLGEYAGSKK